MMRALFLALFLPLLACGGDKDDGIYETCESADDCTVPDGASAACLDKGDEGYCTWECSVDDDCVADDSGDPSDSEDRVCASFEDEAAMYCFPSCEDDEDTCPDGMTCRSTGGGSDNRKVCFPDG